MRIHRFDAEVSIPVTEFGSRLRAAPITGERSACQVSVLHLPAGGLVGRHEAPVRELFCVVAGSGWVSGREGARRELGPGWAAEWDEGELHEAGSASGLTAVSITGELDLVTFSVTKDIVVSDYDPQWPEWFEAIRAVVWPAVEEVALRIDHVGSTAVPGIAAKPVIDLDIVVADETDVESVIERLAGIGYRWRGDLGVIGREAFHPPAGSDLPEHHLYLVVEGNRAHLDHVLLRDLLRSDAEARRRYGDLKRANVEVAGGDIEIYVAAKASLVAELLTRARSQAGLEPVDYWVPG